MSEAVIRTRYRNLYYVWTPYTRGVFELPPGRAPGVSGPSRFSINRFGLRGDDFGSDQEYRILALGASTTESLILDDRVAWPHLAQELVNARTPPRRVWIGNAGRAGLRMPHHELHAKYLLAQYPRIDAVILLVGINELQFRLALDTDYQPEPVNSPEYETRLMEQAFQDLPRRYRAGRVFERTEIWRMLRTVKRGVLAKAAQDNHAQDTHGANLVEWRRRRQAASTLREALPDLDSALEEYGRRLETTIREARRFHARVILMTQPAMWRPGLPPSLVDLLWMGGIGDFQGEGGRGYYGVEALARGLDRYNRTLLDVCRKNSVECIDLAGTLPRDVTSFYDDVHFNDSGSRTVARALADYLLAHPVNSLWPASN